MSNLVYLGDAQSKQAKRAAKESRKQADMVARQAAKTARFDEKMAFKRHKIEARQALKSLRRAEPVSASGGASTGLIVTAPASAPSSASASGYNPDAAVAAITGNALPPTPAPSSATPTGGYYPSGYNPDAADMVAQSTETPETSTSDSVMKQKLLVIRNSNPEYYDFIRSSVQSMPGINSTLEGLGADVPGAVTAPTASTESAWAQVLGRISNEYANYQLKKAEQKQQSQKEAQDKILAAQQSNEYLTGQSARGMMYLFGGLALLAVWWLATRRAR